MSEDQKPPVTEKQPKKKTVYVLPDKTEIVFPCRLKSAGTGSFTDTEESEPVRYSPGSSTKRAIAPQKGSWLASQLDAGNIVVEGDED